MTTDSTLGDGCSLPPPSTWVRHGSYHTIPMVQAPITASISSRSAVVCPGGSLRLTITFHNRGGTDHVIESPSILLHGGMEKWPIAELAPVTVPAHGSVDVETDATIPLVAPGESWRVVVYQYASRGRLTIAPPD